MNKQLHSEEPLVYRGAITHDLHPPLFPRAAGARRQCRGSKHTATLTRRGFAMTPFIPPLKERSVFPWKH